MSWAAGDLGAQPVTTAIHIAGQWMVAILLVTLALRPARTLLNWPRAMLLRRMVGLGALSYGILHLVLFADQQNWQLLHVASEITLRIYLTIGFVALLGLGILGITSTDSWQRRLGRRWVNLHRLLYGLMALGLLHFFMQSKADVGNATIATGIFAWLMLWRALARRLDHSLPAIIVITLGATLLALLAEYLWYGYATHIPPLRVLQAEETLRFGPRPAGFVLLLGALAIAAIVMRQAWQRPERVLSHVILYGFSSAAMILLAWGMGYTGAALPNSASPAMIGVTATLLAMGAGYARARLAKDPLRRWLDALWLAYLAYPLYTVGLADQAAGIIAAVLLSLALGTVVVRIARRSRSAALLLLPPFAGCIALAVTLSGIA